MTIIHSENFDSTSVGSLPSGWMVKPGNAWAVTSAAYVSSPNGLSSSSGDGAWITYTGSGTLADMEVRFDWNPHASDSGIGVVVRGTTDGQSGYFVNPDAATNVGGTYDIYKSVGGSFTKLTSFSLLAAITGNISVRLRVQGSTISANVWPYGTTEPTGFMASVSDSSITAPGYAGLRNQGGTATAIADNFTLDNLTSPTLSVSPASVAVSSVGNSLTLTGTGTSWTAGSPGLPKFTVNGGTIAAQTVASSASASLTYGAPATAETVTITDTSTGAAASLSIVSSGANDFSISPLSEVTSAGVATSAFTVSMGGALTTVESITLSDGGAGGTFTPTSLSWFAAGSPPAKTFTYTPATGTTGAIKTLTASGSGQFTAVHSVSCVVSGGIVPGVATATYAGVTDAQISATEATGGSGTFTLRWYRSTASGSSGSAISGATSESLVDTGLAANADYYYSLQYTDTTSGAEAFSSQAHVKTLESSVSEVIGGIGDSSMMGAYSTFETPFNAMIDQLKYKLTSKQFSGVNRAISGTTSIDWSATSAGSDLANAVAAFETAGVTRIVLMLGTNDSKGSVETLTAAYSANISAIIAYAFGNVSSLKTVHLFSSPFQSLPSGDLSVQNCGRIIAYAGALASLANSKIIYSQPLASYNLFQNNPSLLRDGVHPTDIGDQALGGLWASNLASDLGSAPVTPPAYSRARTVN